MANLDIIARLTGNAQDEATKIDDAIGGIESSGGRSSSALSGLQTVGVAALTAVAAAAVGASLAVGGIAVSSINAAAEMEQQVANIAATMGATKDEIAPLNDLIKDLGLDPNLKVTAVEAGQAIEMLAKNGLSMEQVLNGAAESTVLLANATGADFATAADIGTDAMAIFKIGAEDMMDAVNGITSVTTSSKFGINDYQLALAQGGGVASAAGVSFEDFNTTIAAISPLFKSGSDAGTSLKTMITRLTGSTGPAAEAMAELGIITEDGANQFFTAEGQMKSMGEIAGILQSTLSGLSEEQRTNALQAIFGADAMRAAVGLMEVGEQGFGDLMAQMSQTDALESAATRMDTLSGTLEIIDGVIETVKLSFGQALLPAVRAVANAVLAFADGALPKIEAGLAGLTPIFEDVSSFIGGFTTELSNGQGVWDAAVEALLNWTNVGEAHFETILNTVEAIEAFVAKVQEVAQPIINVVSQFVSWEDVMMALGIAIASVVIPILISLASTVISILATIALPLLALVGVIALVRTAWEQNWGGIQEKAAAVIGFIRGVIGGLVAWWQANWTTIQAVLMTAWIVIQSVIEAALAVIRPAIQTFVENARSGLESFGPALESLGVLWQALQPIIAAVLAVIGALILAFIGVVVGLFNGIAAAIEPFLTTLSFVINGLVVAVTGVAEFLTGLVQYIVALFQGNTEAAEAAWQKMNDGLTNIVLGLVEAIVGAITGLAMTIATLIHGLVTGVIDFFTNLYNTLVGGSIIPDMVNGIIEWIISLKDTFVELVNSLWTTVQGLFETGKETVLGIINGLVGAIQTAFSIDWGAVGNSVIEGIKSGITNAASNLADAAAQAAKAALDAAKAALGINSPSKRGEEEVGEPLVAGILRPLGDRQVINQAVNQMVDSLIRPLETVGQTAALSFRPRGLQLAPAFGSFALPAPVAGGSGGDTIEINIDARGAASGVEMQIKQAVKTAVDAAFAQRGRNADVRIRTR